MSEACRSCAAPIRWVRLIPGHKRHPLDAEPTSDGTIQIVAAGEPDPYPADPYPEAVLLAKSNADAARRSGRELYRSHFSTCPDAGDWRRPR